jgi:LysM repeat protein
MALPLTPAPAAPPARSGRRRLVTAAILLGLIVLPASMVGARVVLEHLTPSVRYVRMDSIPGPASAHPEPSVSTVLLVAAMDLPIGATVSPDGEPADRRTEAVELGPVPMPAPYAVAAGDTLLDIARQVATTVEVIQLLNEPIVANRLQIGQLLVVPRPEGVLEMVDPTQSLREVAQRYGQNPGLLAAFNRLPEERIDVPLGRRAILVPMRAVEPGRTAP